MARAYFLIYSKKSESIKDKPMSINTKRIRQNADLINPISACPFGEPITECPFIPYYSLNNEREQVMQIEVISQDELDELRKFHRDCMERHREGEWPVKVMKVIHFRNDTKVKSTIPPK
jgi:hypothetical protein